MAARFPRLTFSRRRWRRLFRPTTLALWGVSAALVTGAWAFDPSQFAVTRVEIFAMTAAAAAVFVAAALIPTGYAFYLWHAFANALAERRPSPLAKPWVIDGDTIDDRAIGARYRLANIDAPETGDNAKCHWERTRGEESKWAAARLVRNAAAVSVRRTFRIDPFGRRVAFILVDGKDLGELLVAEGLARPWRGMRRKWCGPNGGLALISRAGGRGHSCKTCGA